MVENVAVIGPHTWVVGVEDNLDCRFRWNQNRVPFCAGDFCPSISITSNTCPCRCVLIIVFFVGASSSFATTQGLNQIATADVQAEGTVAVSFDLQDRKIGNPYQVQA